MKQGIRHQAALLAAFVAVCAITGCGKKPVESAADSPAAVQSLPEQMTAAPGSHEKPEENGPAQTEKEEPPYTPEEDRTYEEWLAASMVTGLSMLYPDAQITGIYAASESGMDDEGNSEGVYISFLLHESPCAVRSFPLTAEREEAGTTDIYTSELGFAAFDGIDPAQVPVQQCRKIGVEDIGGLIAQTQLVSVYIH